MTSKELAAALAQRLKISKRQAELLVEAFFDEIKEALKRGEGVCFQGFGSFYVLNQRPRQQRLPSSKTLLVPTRRKVRFKASPKLLSVLVEKEPNR